MSEEKIIQFITDIEKIRDGHKLEATMITGQLEWQQRLKCMSESKAAAYDFVIRKLKRTFNIINNDADSRNSISTP